VYTPTVANDEMFLFVLADYPIEKIIDAFSFYAKTSSEFPAPADIANIIERGNKPPLDRSVYVSISKKEPDRRTSGEWAYLREYEDYAITGRL
jgi:hypothetical protein